MSSRSSEEHAHQWGELAEYTAGWARSCACGVMWWDGRPEPDSTSRGHSESGPSIGRRLYQLTTRLERDRREPDKVLCYVRDLRRLVPEIDPPWEDEDIRHYASRMGDEEV